MAFNGPLFSAIREQSNKAVDYASTLLSGTVIGSSWVIGEVNSIYYKLEALSRDIRINDLKSIRLVLKPVWQMEKDGRTQELASLKAKLDRSDWLYRCAIRLPYSRGERMPFYRVANLMFESPLHLAFPDVPKVFHGLGRFAGLIGTGYIPLSSLNWTIAEHELFGRKWRNAVTEWNKWLTLVTDQGFVPYNNVEFRDALYKDGYRAVPSYVDKWFLVRYGDFKLSANESLLQDMAYSSWDKIPLYALSDLIPFTESDQNSLMQELWSGYTNFIVKRFCDFGGNQHQLNRLLSFGIQESLKYVSGNDLNDMNVHALNTRNFAVLNTLGPAYFTLMPSKISPTTEQQADALVQQLILIRRDMWDYLLEYTSKSIKAYIGVKARQALGITEI
jgi:hypothetical protein